MKRKRKRERERKCGGCAERRMTIVSPRCVSTSTRLRERRHYTEREGASYRPRLNPASLPRNRTSDAERRRASANGSSPMFIASSRFRFIRRFVRYLPFSFSRLSPADGGRRSAPMFLFYVRISRYVFRALSIDRAIYLSRERSFWLFRQHRCIRSRDLL